MVDSPLKKIFVRIFYETVFVYGYCFVKKNKLVSFVKKTIEIKTILTSFVKKTIAAN